MQSSTGSEVMGKEAELQVRLPNGRLKCIACARLCEIPEGKTGLCGIRGVTNNNLYLYVYGRVIAGHIDRIEKNLWHIIDRVHPFILLQQQVAIGYANIAKITIYPSGAR